MAAGSGLTAAVDASITRTFVGITTSAYATPSTNGLFAALFSTQFTSATKAGATEYTTTGYSTYARQQVGTSAQGTGFGWTVNAYVNSTGVLFTNVNTLTFPVVPAGGATQTLFAVGFCLSSTIGTVDISLFFDLTASQSQPVGIGVVIQPYTGAGTGAAFTTY